MLTAEEILTKRLKGTRWFRHKDNPKRHKILHIASNWALHWHAGESYGCGYGQMYVPGGVDLILIPESLESHAIGSWIWDTGRDSQGPVTAKRLKRLIEIVTEEINADRSNAIKKIKERIAAEFSR